MMLEYDLIDRAQVPGGVELQLLRSGGQTAPQLLIGGYGMGFTLRAALAALGDDASVVVAELVPQILDWARGPMAALTDGCLDDDRVTLVVDDVGLMIHSAANGYGAILLDVDNGPEGLTRRRNDMLYSAQGLEASRNALRPGGVLAVWSADGDGDFTQRLEHAGFAVTEVKVGAVANPGSAAEPLDHHIWFAQRD